MAKYSIIKEDDKAFHVHDGKRHFLVAKNGLPKAMHEQIRGMPKYADGGLVEDHETELGDLNKEIGLPAVAPQPQIAPQAQEIAPVQQQQEAINPLIPTNYQNDLLKDYQSGQASQISGIKKMADTEEQAALDKSAAIDSIYSPEEEARLQQRQVDLAAKEKELDAQNEQMFQASLNDKIDPNRLWKNMGTGNKILAAISLVLGGAASGGRADNNAALNVLNNAIDRDVKAQMDDRGNRNTLYAHNLQKYRDTVAAEQATKLQLHAFVAGKMASIGAKYGGQEARARADQLIGAVREQGIPLKAGLLQQVQQQKIAQAALGQTQKENISPEVKLEMLNRAGVLPKERVEPTYKELKEAQNLENLYKEGISVFDDVAKLNTLGSKLSPNETSKIEAKRDAFLDKLTKDTSGRVTPETVSLVRGVFPKALDDENTIEYKRRNMHNFLLEKSAFPMLTPYGLNPIDKIKIYQRPARNIPSR